MSFKVTRRWFLRLVAPSLLLPGTAFRLQAQAAEDALILLVDGIGPDTPSDRLGAFVDPFLASEIPVGLVLRPPKTTETTAPYAAQGDLRRLLSAGPDLVEPVLRFPDIAALPPYLQRRMASDGLRWFEATMGGVGQPAPLTIATDADGPANFDAVRCLGIRGALAPAVAPPVASAGCARLTVCLSGATVISVVDSPDPARLVAAALDQPGWAQIALSLAGIETASVAEARLRGQRAVDAIARELELGRRFLALPRDHALWFGTDQPRYLALRLRAGSPAAAGAKASLVEGLRALEVPFSDSFPLGLDAPDPWPKSACLELPPDEASTLSWNVGPRCAAAVSPVDALSPRAVATLDLLVQPGDEVAFDDRGLLLRGEVPLSDADQLQGDNALMRDAILVIEDRDYLTPAAREATLARLAGFRADPGGRLVDVPGFLQATFSPDPVFELLRDSRRSAVEPPDPNPLAPLDWLADARQAWIFFDRFTIPATGLCVDTADVQPDGEWLHRELTMWDVGSLIAAVMAAHELGLMSDADFVARAEKLVQALPVTDIGGRRLPGEVISSDSSRTLSTDFNACDTGRLLSVLRELDAHPLTPDISRDKTARWDLGSVIVDGRVHSVVDGTLVDRFPSHCAHYTARAFRDRGFVVASPYEGTDQSSDTDRAMLLLLSLGGFGALGAEPLLFEALEMGMSEPSAVLAEVLFTAQRMDAERTGELRAVSEAPLNRAPWFSYQGLNLTGEGERWMVSAASGDTRFSTPAFRREIALVNTKAAYLWAAYRPGPYATRLVRHVRSAARVEGVGFSPGVFAATGEGMAGYADINTNGVVLEAIAFILRGRKTRLG